MNKGFLGTNTACHQVLRDKHRVSSSPLMKARPRCRGPIFLGRRMRCSCPWPRHQSRSCVPWRACPISGRRAVNPRDVETPAAAVIRLRTAACITRWEDRTVSCVQCVAHCYRTFHIPSHAAHLRSQHLDLHTPPKFTYHTFGWLRRHCRFDPGTASHRHRLSQQQLDASVTCACRCGP